MGDTSGLGVNEQVLGAVGVALVLAASPRGQRGSRYNVLAMPPVAKMPQRTVDDEEAMVKDVRWCRRRKGALNAVSCAVEEAVWMAA